MTEYEELFKKFSKLGLDKKRNSFNEEILKVALLTKEYLKKYNQELGLDFYNYQEGIDSKMTESELLDENYKNIYYIKMQLLLLLNLMDSE